MSLMKMKLNFLGTALHRYFTVDPNELNLQHHHLENLDDISTGDKVWAIVKDIHQDKELGLDGFMVHLI